MKTSKNKTFVILLCVAVVFLAFFVVSTVRAYGGGDTIRPGVTAGGISLGNLTAEEAAEKLHKTFENTTFDKPIYIVLGDVEKKVVPADFLTTFEYDETAKNAFAYGREGNFFSRVGQGFISIFIKHDIPMEISVDEIAYEEALDVLIKDVKDKVQEHAWEISEDKLIVTTGHPGLLPDKRGVSDAIFNTIRTGSYDEKIVFDYENREPTPLSAEFLYERVASDAKDAFYALEEGKVVIHPHSVGIKFDKTVAQERIDANKGNGVTFEIPLQISNPKFTTADIEAQLFADCLGEHETKFNTGDVGRSKNIALAAHKINGTILAPGEIFSYNGVVGERSYSEGFATAHVYVNGETVDGVGGGICQVSSTLFNAVVYANLEIVERVNHQLTVSYVPLGRDATVDYGNIDFRFKNTSGQPIKLVCTTDNGLMYVGIFGTKEDESLEVSFDTAVIRELAPPVRKADDPTLPKGEEKVVKAGTSGYVVDTYKIVKRDGKDPERTYLCRSTYNGSFREILVGTGEAVPENPSAEGNGGAEIDVPNVSGNGGGTEILVIPSPSLKPSADPLPTPTAEPQETDIPERTETPVETEEATESSTSDTGL